MIKKCKLKLKRLSLGVIGLMSAHQALAVDRLSAAMSGDVQDMLGSSGAFWKIFILVDVILSAAMAVKTKNPMVFVGVFAIALIPAFLVNTFVF